MRSHLIRRALCILIFAVACATARNAFADITVGGVCPGGAQSAQSTDGNNAICVGGTWKYPAYTFQSAAASLGASCAGTAAGTVRYNATLINIEACDGTTWRALAPSQTGYNPAIAGGTGFFVLTNTTWDGNLGGLAGANAKCLTELTTNTNWRGYSTANSNGQLVASKVKAFLCSASGNCQNPTASTTFYFAKVGDASAGGASFTTSSIGEGPDNFDPWNAANHFNGSAMYWTARAHFACGACGCDCWVANGGNQSSFCGAWTTNSGASSGSYGISTNNSGFRTGQPVEATTCDQPLRLICFVNP